MSADEFEWDERKAEANVAKHGISFEIAEQVFQDPAALDWFEVMRMARNGSTFLAWCMIGFSW